MRYNEINWDNVESAVATEAGLQLTYRTPQVGVGQTQLIPRDGAVGQTRVVQYGGPYRSNQSPLLLDPGSSPPGSYVQVQPMIEKHGITLQEKSGYVSSVNSELDSFFWLIGTWLGPVNSNALGPWVCARLKEVQSTGFSISQYLKSDFVTIFSDGKPVATLQVSQCS